MKLKKVDLTIPHYVVAINASNNNILVAKAFVPNPDNKPIVHHIDTDKLKSISIS